MPSVFQSEHLNVRDHLQDLGVNEKLILKLSFHNRMRDFSWIQLLRTDRVTYSCGIDNKTTGEITGGVSVDQFNMGRLIKDPTS
jgi:hypothetical protein